MAARQGNKHHAAKMTSAKVRRARTLYETFTDEGVRKYSIADLAKKFGMSHPAMSSILHYRTWRHVT